jgi:predicted HTH domain antitoxin
MAHTLQIEYDDALLLDVAMPREEFEREAVFLLAAKLYERGRLPSGQAARLCGMERVAFLLALPRVGVSMTNLKAEDLDIELDFAHGR